MTSAGKPALAPNVADRPLPALRLQGVGRRLGGKILLQNISAEFYPGEITLITGGRGAARTELARLLGGLSAPTIGRVIRSGAPGPTPGAAVGFDVGGPVLRGLEMRAAAYGINLTDYVEAIASLMRAPGLLRKSLAQLAAFDRLIVLFAGAYLLPCTHYVAEKSLLPTEPAARKALIPAFRAARARAAFVTLGDKASAIREIRPDHTATVTDDGLEYLTGE